MPQFYSDPERETDTYAMPDCEVFQLTAEEAAEYYEDDIYTFSKRREFRLASMNAKVREAMIEAMIEEIGVKGGWFYRYCFPGCMPEGAPVGPYESEAAAIKAAQDEAADY